jgi:hypothetical protein
MILEGGRSRDRLVCVAPPRRKSFAIIFLHSPVLLHLTTDVPTCLAPWFAASERVHHREILIAFDATLSYSGQQSSSTRHCPSTLGNCHGSAGGNSAELETGHPSHAGRETSARLRLTSLPDMNYLQLSPPDVLFKEVLDVLRDQGASRGIAEPAGPPVGCRHMETARWWLTAAFSIRVGGDICGAPFHSTRGTLNSSSVAASNRSSNINTALRPALLR